MSENQKIGDHTVSEWVQMIEDKVVTPSPEVLTILKEKSEYQSLSIFLRKNLEKEVFFLHSEDLRKVDKTTVNKDSEDRLQSDCFQWFHNTYQHLRGCLYHVPNQLTGLVHQSVSNKMKAMGLVAGIPDLVFHFRARTYFFELKKPNSNGILSKAQKKVHKVLDQQRFVVYLVNDYETFVYLIETIIADTSEQFTHGVSREDYYYKHRVFDFLYSQPVGAIFSIEEMTEESTRGKFMNYVTEFMVEGFDKLDGFEILFTNDYLNVKKLSYAKAQ